MDPVYTTSYFVIKTLTLDVIPGPQVRHEQGVPGKSGKREEGRSMCCVGPW